MTVVTPVKPDQEDLTLRMGGVKMMSEDDVRTAPQVMESDEAGFGALTSERGTFPLRSIKVSARLSALSSHVTLDQTFLNAFDTPLEATYIFPLPPQAAVTSFRFEVKDRVVEGVIKERDEARQEYAQAVQDGHRAAIVEEERQGVFTVRVGNIGPKETASVRLTMAAPIPVSDGEATFRFPLVVAPRYIPGVRLPGADVGRGSEPDTNETPDASRITPPRRVNLPGFLDPVQLGIEVEFDVTSLPVSNVRCSLHTVTVSDIETDASQDATCPPIAIRRLRLNPAADSRLDRDFILRFSVTVPDHVAASLILSDDSDSESEEGTWQLTLVAPQGGGKGAVVTPRDVVFVIDRSGSMEGWKMVAARSAAARVVDTLSDADRFTVLAFDHGVECPFDTSAFRFATPAPPDTSAFKFATPATPDTSAFKFATPAPPDTSAVRFATSAPPGGFTGLAATVNALFGLPSPSTNLFGGSNVSPQTGTNTPAFSTGGLFGPPPCTGVFGAPPASGTVVGNPSSTGGLLGNSSSSTGGIFGNSSSSSGGIFGNSFSSSGGIFGNNSSSSGGVFGNPTPTPSLFETTASNGSIFGNPSTSSQNTPSNSSLFGAPLNANKPEPAFSSGGLFGAASKSGSIFGPPPNGSAFGPPQPPSLFGPPVNTSTFGQPNPGFVNQVSPAQPVALVAANYANRQRARNFLATLSARGGTEMAAPLTRAADALQGLEGLEVSAPVEGSGGFWPARGGTAVRDPVLVLVTDGQVGNEDWILGQLAPKMKGIRIFTLGIDQSVNETFLRRLSGLSPGGACELVESQGRLEYAMDRIHRLIATPVLSDIRIDGPQGSIPETVTPARVPGLFPGVPVVVSGRYRKVPDSAPAFVTVTGKTAAGENGTEVVRAREKPTAAARALWARAHICDLDDRFAVAAGPRVFGVPPAEPETPDQLRARILKTSLRFQVLSRFTAFVAVDRAEKLPSTAGEVTRVVQPVEHPAGWQSGAAINLTPLFGQASNPLFNPPSGFGQTPKLSFGAPRSTALFGAAPAPSNTAPTFGAVSHSAFGASSHSPAFGASPQQSVAAANQPGFGDVSHSGFGASSYGPALGASPLPSNPGFGASQSTFGPSSGSAFGGSTTSPFGGPSNSTQSTLGAPSNTAFGAPSQSTQLLFEAASNSAFGGSPTTPFGAPPQSISGASAPNFGSSTSPFGAVSHSAFGASSQSAFGGSSQSSFGSSTAPSFGGNALSCFGPSSGSAFGGLTRSPFGAPSQSVFGASPVFPTGGSSQSAFGGLSQSPFGAPSQSAFGASPILLSGSSSQPAFGGSSQSPFDAPSQSAFGASPVFPTGGLPQSLFGGSSQPSFAASSAPSLSWFGGSIGPAFGASSQSGSSGFTPAFGGSLFGALSQPTAGAFSCSAFGVSPAPGASTGGFGGGSSTPGLSTGVFGAASSVPGESTGVFGAATSGTSSFGGAPNPGGFGPAATSEPTKSWGTGFSMSSIPCALTSFSIPLPESDAPADESSAPAVAGFGGLASACLGALNALKADENSETRGRLVTALKELRGRLTGDECAWVGEAISLLENENGSPKLDAMFFGALEAVLNRIKYPGSCVPA